MSENLRLLVLANGAVGHTQRWVDYFVDRGDDVHLASLEHGVPTRAREHDLPSLVPVPALKYPMTVPWVRRLLKKIEPHVVAAHFVPNYGFLGALLGYRPLVIVAWGSDVLLNPRQSRFHLWRARYALESADAVLSDAEVLTRAITELGIQPRRIETYTFGVDTSRFRPSEIPKPEPPIVLSIRQLLPLYGVEDLVRAVAAVIRRSGRPFRVRILGQGADRDRLRRLAADLGIANHIWFAPARVSDDELIDELRNASIYVSTSRSDSTSVSLLEAMACGAAPVVTDLPGNREWIRDGENGILVPVEQPERLADGIVGVLEDPGRAARFAESNLRLVRSRADWARNMERTRRLLLELAGRKAA